MQETTKKSIAEFCECSLDELEKAYFGARDSLEFCEDREQYSIQHKWFLLIDAIAGFRFPDNWPPENA